MWIASPVTDSRVMAGTTSPGLNLRCTWAMAIEYRPTVGTAVDARGNWDIFAFRMSDRLQALHLFVRVAHTASFSRAGREFGMSQPSASRIIADLERRIGVTLFTRTTRAVELTEAGSEDRSRLARRRASLQAG